MKPNIPKEEFYQRISKAKKLMALQNIDILFAFGNEMEPQYQKYFSNFWPSFETAGIIISQNQKPLLLVGPESKKRAIEAGIIEDVYCLEVFRESTSPGYSGMHLNTFTDAIEYITQNQRPKKASIAGLRLLPCDIYNEFKNSLSKFGDVEIIADNIVDKLRSIKSPNEIACIRHACRITAATMQYLLDNIHAGMTELQIKGLALSKMYELGAEGEAYPMWVLSTPCSDYAIGRSRQKVIHSGDIIQLQIGARYEGYASTIARPVVLGSPQVWFTETLHALYDGYDAIMSELKAGNNAGHAAKQFAKAMRKNGFYDSLLYGPCHGLGIVECESPWIEEDSDYVLSDKMTFGLDLYIENKEKKCGIRVEDSICITQNGTLNMTDFPRKLFTI